MKVLVLELMYKFALKLLACWFGSLPGQVQRRMAISLQRAGVFPLLLLIYGNMAFTSSQRFTNDVPHGHSTTTDGYGPEVRFSEDAEYCRHPPQKPLKRKQILRSVSQLKYHQRVLETTTIRRRCDPERKLK